MSHKILKALTPLFTIMIVLTSCAAQEETPIPAEQLSVTDTQSGPIKLGSNLQIVCVANHAFLHNYWRSKHRRTTKQFDQYSLSRYAEQDAHCPDSSDTPANTVTLTDTWGKGIPADKLPELSMICIGDDAFIAIEQAGTARYAEQDKLCS